MSKFTSRATLVLSTGHLTDRTLNLMESYAKKDFAGCGFSFLTGPWGYMVSTFLADNEQLPLDLRHVLNFAKANLHAFVLFDMDGEDCECLPYYGDSNIPTEIPGGYTAAHFTESPKGVKMVKSSAFAQDDLYQGARPLDDEAPYQTEESTIEIGNMVVRLRRVEVEGDEDDHAVRIAVYAADDDAGRAFNDITIYESDVAESAA